MDFVVNEIIAPFYNAERSLERQAVTSSWRANRQSYSASLSDLDLTFVHELPNSTHLQRREFQGS